MCIIIGTTYCIAVKPITVTSYATIRLFVEQLVQANNKENLNLALHEEIHRWVNAFSCDFASRGDTFPIASYVITFHLLVYLVSFLCMFCYLHTQTLLNNFALWTKYPYKEATLMFVNIGYNWQK